MTVEAGLALNEQDQKRRDRVSRQAYKELVLALSNWEGWERVANIGADLWSAAGRGEINPDDYFYDEESPETQVVANGTWG